MNTNVVIMGPIGVGKSAVATELSKRLGVPRVELDEERERIYAKTGFSPEEAERRYARHGIMGWYAYQKPYELMSVRQILEECTGAVIDFGGGQSVYEEEDQIAEFLRLMAPIKNSFLLMPYEDAKKSIALLRKRTNRAEAKMNELFVRARSGRLAARHIIYTETKTVAQIADKIMPLLEE